MGNGPPGSARLRHAKAGGLLGLAAALFVNDLRLGGALSFHGERVIILAVAVVAGAVLAAFRLRLVVASAFGLAAALWLAVALTPIDRPLTDGLVREDPLAPADAIYVLGSDVQPDGDPSSEALNRLVHGLELVGRGLAPRLVLGELDPSHGRYAPTATRLLQAFHLDAELLTVGPVATTRDEAVLVAELARKRGFRRVLLVTARLHSRRAAAAFEAEGLEVIAAPTREGSFDLERLTSPDDRVRAFPDILHERLGLLVYRWHGWLDPAKPQP